MLVHAQSTFFKLMQNKEGLYRPYCLQYAGMRSGTCQGKRDHRPGQIITVLEYILLVALVGYALCE